MRLPLLDGRASGRASFLGALTLLELLVFLELLGFRELLPLRERLLPRALEPVLAAGFAPLLCPLPACPLLECPLLVWPLPVWPLRWPQAGAEDFVVRAPEEAPFDGRVALPLDRAPLPLE